MAGWGLDGYGNSSALLQAASTTVKGPNYCRAVQRLVHRDVGDVRGRRTEPRDRDLQRRQRRAAPHQRRLGAAGRDRRHERRADQLQHRTPRTTSLEPISCRSGRTRSSTRSRAHQSRHPTTTTTASTTTSSKTTSTTTTTSKTTTTTTTTAKTTPASTQARAPKPPPPLPTLPTLTMSGGSLLCGDDGPRAHAQAPPPDAELLTDEQVDGPLLDPLAVRRRHVRGERPVLPLPPGTSCVLVVRLHGHAPLALVPGCTREPHLHGICPAVPLGVDVLELHRLHGEKLLEPVAAELAPVARLLVAAERRERIEHAAVDLDLAGPQPPGDLLGTLRVA